MISSVYRPAFSVNGIIRRMAAVMIGFVLSGACTVLIGYVDCNHVVAVVLVVLSTAFIGVSSAAVLGVNQLDLSSQYAGHTVVRCTLPYLESSL